MPKADSKMNQICQNIMEMTRGDIHFQQINIGELAAFDSFGSSLEDCEGLDSDIALLRPLQLEKQHGRIYSDSSIFAGIALDVLS